MKTISKFALTVMMTALSALPLFTQELSVKSLRLAENDLTARTEPRLDANKQPCALLKVQVRDQITEAQGNVVGNVIDKGGEKWIYFTDGTKQTNLLFRNNPPLSIYFPDHGIPSLRANCTYVLTITGESQADSGTQELRLQYSPTDATVLIDGQLQHGHKGKLSLSLSVGEHQVIIAKDGYLSFRANTEIVRDRPTALSISLMKDDKVPEKSSVQVPNKDDTESMSAEEMYRKGKEYLDAKNYTEAIKYFRKSAEQGNSEGQNALGFMYFQDGYGVQQDYAESVKWFRKSAEQGDSRGQCNLGLMYRNGYGVPQDNAEAVKWYRKSAEQGNATGQFNLGLMYQYGYGVHKSMSKARHWYQKAADQGDQFAIDALRLLQ